jgi:PIN domain nuclease of toxin-antitoxin system
VAVSAASAWEIAIKQAIGVLSGPDDLSAEFATNGNRLVDHGIAHLRA